VEKDQTLESHHPITRAVNAPRNGPQQHGQMGGRGFDPCEHTPCIAVVNKRVIMARSLDHRRLKIGAPMVVVTVVVLVAPIVDGGHP